MSSTRESSTRAIKLDARGNLGAMRLARSFGLLLAFAPFALAGCGASDSPSSAGGSGMGGGTSSGGAVSAHGGAAAGGTSSVGGTSSSGGMAGGAGTFAASGSGGVAGGGQSGTSGGSGGASGASGGFGQGGAIGGAGQGGSAGNGQGGSAGAGSYRPCPSDGSACKILPLGDSITWGIQYDGAYRVELFSKAVGGGHKITFTGSLSNGPNTVMNQPFPKSNEGHSGWTIDQISGLIPSPALNTPPNIILLMIGTNDVYAASGQATMADRLGKLLDKIIGAAPNALLVVAKITPLANGNGAATIKAYNDAIPGLVQSRAAAGKHILLADMNTGFTPAMLSNDGVHPQKSGYDFMGDSWYAVINGVLP